MAPARCIPRLASSTARISVSWSGLFITARNFYRIGIQDWGRIFRRRCVGHTFRGSHGLELLGSGCLVRHPHRRSRRLWKASPLGSARRAVGAMALGVRRFHLHRLALGGRAYFPGPEGAFDLNPPRRERGGRRLRNRGGSFHEMPGSTPVLFRALDHFFRIERIPITVNHLAVLRDRHVDARTAFSIGNFDGLWHRIWILPAVLHRLEAKAGSIHAGVLGALFWRHLFKFMGEFSSGVSLQFPLPPMCVFPR